MIRYVGLFEVKALTKSYLIKQYITCYNALCFDQLKENSKMSDLYVQIENSIWRNILEDIPFNPAISSFSVFFSFRLAVLSFPGENV